MKILEIITSLGSGGAERIVVDLCNELSFDNEVILVVLYPFDKYSFYLKDLSPKVNIVCLNKKSGFDISLFFRMRKLISAEKPDIVHTHLSGIVYTFLSYCFASKTKFIHTVHSDAQYEAENYLNTLFRKFAFKFHRVTPVTISEDSQKSFYDFYKEDSALIYNGRPDFVKPAADEIKSVESEIEALKVNKNALVITNVGRLNKVKNQVCLAKAIHALNLQGYKIELINIGEGNDKEVVSSIEELASPYVHLIGSRKNPRMYVYVSDAFCLSSVIEGMPITLIECFSVGAIPLCTPVGGINSMIQDGVNGMLADGTSQKDLERLLIRFIKSSEVEKTKMKEQSLLSFEPYNIHNCCCNYIKLMNSLRK